MTDKPRQEVRTISDPKNKFTVYALMALMPALAAFGLDVSEHGADGVPFYGDKSEYTQYGAALSLAAVTGLLFSIIRSSHIKIEEEVITYKKVQVVTHHEVEDKRERRVK